MRLYIWEGHGISAAYHDDGTLVVLAETVDDARNVIYAEKSRKAIWDTEHVKERRLWYRLREREWMRENGVEYGQWETEGGKRLLAMRAALDYPNDDLIPDGSDAAILREPDRIVELDTPCIVAFNGGGYD